MVSRLTSRVVVAAFLLCVGLLSAFVGPAGAGIRLPLPPLPRLFLPAPPPLVPIPGTYVYTAPDAEADIVFYQGAWYRPHGGHWYRANGYNGPWSALSVERVPRALTGLPPNFRRVPPGHERMPYEHVNKNWKSWERERHWDKHDKRDRRHDDDDRGRGHGRGHDRNDHGDRD